VELMSQTIRRTTAPGVFPGGVAMSQTVRRTTVLGVFPGRLAMSQTIQLQRSRVTGAAPV
jgi:hypothetical protein